MRQEKRDFFGNYVRYVIMAMAALPIILSAAPSVRACDEIPDQQILGDPIDITCYSSGQMELYFQNLRQYKDYYPGCSWGSILMFDYGETTKKYADLYHACHDWHLTAFTPVSNTKPNDWEIDTVLSAGYSGVTITQKVEYTNGNGYYKMTWFITNGSGKTYENIKFFHGGNATFGGLDNAASYWNSDLGMVYLKNPEVGGYMGFYGDPDPETGSVADRYFGGSVYEGMWQAISGNLSNTVDPSNDTDAGYYLQWNLDSLAPGETWIITAYERWTGEGGVEVSAPEEQSVTKGNTVDLAFTIQNLQATTDTFDLEAESDLGWPVSLPGGNSVTIEPGQSVTVIVRVELPEGEDESVDMITLTAISQADPGLAGSGSVDITGIPGGKLIDPEDSDDSTRRRHHNDYCFISTAESSSNFSILVLAAIFIGLGYIIRFRTADVRIDSRK
ncbi:MAG TPA: hypothetical protein PLA18_15405 [Deltaproteobacteria bacterium]|jgi:hypothetical protein|nr:hypothetical protein [Deltaproteobacteria bacterium]